MIILGLTGSIGMGKTTAASMLQQMGCGIHSADRAVFLALTPTGAAFEEVALTFPECWDKKNHTIKKDILADIVFKNGEKKQQLEEILHPIVRLSQQKFIQDNVRLGKNIVVLEIPLLFETKGEERVDYTICVSAPFHVQNRRVMARPGMTTEKFCAILATQISDRQKQKMSDFVVQTGMGFAYTYRQLEKIVRVVK